MKYVHWHVQLTNVGAYQIQDLIIHVTNY